MAELWAGTRKTDQLTPYECQRALHRNSRFARPISPAIGIHYQAPGWPIWAAALTHSVESAAMIFEGLVLLADGQPEPCVKRLIGRVEDWRAGVG
jgi:hypothetical protein